MGGHPDKMYQTEDCVENIKSRGGFYWNDENCAKVNSFICEKTDVLSGCVRADGVMQDDGIMSQDELLAKLMSGDMHAPRIGLKSAQSSKKSQTQKKKAKKAKKEERKQEKEEEKKENKAKKTPNNANPSEAKKEMKSNLRKALQG